MTYLQYFAQHSLKYFFKFIFLYSIYIFFYFLMSTDSEQSYKDISSIEGEVWAVRADGTLQRRLGVTAEHPAGTTWQTVLHAHFIHVSARGGCFA